MRMRKIGAVLGVLALLAATPATLSAQTKGEIEAMKYDECMDEAWENYQECLERVYLEIFESACYSGWGYAKLACTIGLVF
ncbi:MAG: hypothetical protein R6W82_06710 [bacterium]